MRKEAYGMILRKRSRPIVLQKYEALLRRLPPNYHRLSEIERAFRKRQKGYYGERKVDEYVKKLQDMSTILHNIQLHIQGQLFQIDTLLITPNFLYILEIKNFGGIITFDTHFNQFTRLNKEKEEGYRSPIIQASLQARQLEKWLQLRQLTNIPIFYFVVISYPSTIIKVEGDKKEIRDIVMHAEEIPNRILDMEQKFEANKNQQINKSIALPHQQIGKLIDSHSSEFDIDVMTTHKIKASELIRGVQCPECKYLGLPRIYGGWYCSSCQRKYTSAHKQALTDYFLLIKPTITNSECMNFLRIPLKIQQTVY